jgi:hypothetical protein
VSPSSQIVRRLFPGCGIENHGVPGHRCSPFRSVLSDGFEIGLLPGGGIPGHWCSPGGFAYVSGHGNRVTSRWRNPRSSQVSCRLGWWSSSRNVGLLPGCGIPGHRCSPLLSVRYFQVADSNAIASQVMAEIPFLRLADGVLAGFAGVPGHVSPPEERLSQNGMALI